MNKVLSTVLLGSLVLGTVVPSVYASGLDGNVANGDSNSGTHVDIVQDIGFFEDALNDTKQSIFNELVLQSGKVKEIMQNEEGVVSGFLINSKDNEIFISVSEDTLYLDNDNTLKGALKDIKVGDTIYVYRSIVETRSLPPQTHGYIVLYNVSDSINVPKFCEVESIEEGAGSGEKVILTDNGGLYIMITEKTIIKDYDNADKLTLSDIKVGDTVLCWIGPVLFSYPGQTTGNTIMKVSDVFEDETDINNTVSMDNFKDITIEHRAYEAFKTLVEKGIVSGVSSDMIAPDDTLTRSSFVTMLARACADLNGVEDLSQYNGVSQFKDNILEAWFNPYVNWAFEYGVTNGISENEFGVNSLVTKEQMVTMIHNYVKNNNVALKTVDIENQLMIDYDTSSSWSLEALNWASNLGLIDLDENGNYNPTSNATRSDMAILLTKFLQIVDTDAVVDVIDVVEADAIVDGVGDLEVGTDSSVN